MSQSRKFIYEQRPFKIRNADEFDLSQILNLFVSPLQGLTSPFDYSNAIVKGRMGSGKTMYLRANYAFYLYSLVDGLITGEELVLPVLIRLSDFQHVRDPERIYRAIIIRIVEELCNLYRTMGDAHKLAQIHTGFRALPPAVFSAQKLSTSLQQLAKLGANEYVERVTAELGLTAGVQPEFFTLSGEYRKQRLVELKKTENPGIRDVEECYENLLRGHGGRLLLLFDEAGALDRRFFREAETESFFEILMNQFRTADYVRTKVAVYPNSVQDILTETRYGDAIRLEEDIHDDMGYSAFREKTLHIIANYLQSVDEDASTPNSFLEVSESGPFGDAIEQVINASRGNMRRLIQILDSSMEVAFSYHKGDGVVSKSHVLEALERLCREVESLYTEQERQFLKDMTTACRSRSTYRFQFPYMSMVLNKYTSRSQEFNIIDVVDIGAGRRGSTYAFDYTYCVAHDIPTHYIDGSERINRERTLRDGSWIRRTAKLNESIIKEAEIKSKIEGVIELIRDETGFVAGDDGNDYFFRLDNVIEEDRKRSISQGRRVRFVPFQYSGTDIKVAASIEIL